MGGLANSSTYGKINESTEYYVEDGYYINSVLRNGDELSEGEKEYIKELDDATSGNVTQNILYRVVDANTVFEGMGDFEYDDLRAHILLGDNAYDSGKYSQNKKQRMENIVDSIIGKTTKDAGYMSTTTSEDTAFHKAHDNTHGRNRVILKLTDTKGTKGADLSRYDKKFDYNTPENETLLARNNSYTYNKIYAKNGQVIIEAKLHKRK